MIQLTDKLWCGDSDDAYKVKKGAILNVARDLIGSHKWPGVEYAQVGLVDGPGNELSDYVAAVLSILSLLKRHEMVLVYDHDSSRALVVGMMALNLLDGKFRPDPLSWSHWATWEERLADARKRTGAELREPAAAHQQAYGKIPYGLLEAVT